MSILSRLSISFIILVSGFVCKAQSTNPYLVYLCDSIRQVYKVPSMSCAFITADSIYYGIAGSTEHGTDHMAQLSQPYHIGSNSKGITSYIAMKLVEEGAIKLDTRFFDLVSDIKGRRWRYRKITLRKLLNHTSRIPAFTTGAEFDILPDWLAGLSVPGQRLGFASLAVRMKPLKKGMHYSNAGYVLAALMLERASGKPFEQLVEQYMGDYQIQYGFPVRLDSTYPKGHWIENDSMVAHDSSHPYSLPPYMRSAGDMSLTLPHYARFIQEHVKGLRGRSDELALTSFLEMHLGHKGYALAWANQLIANGEHISTHDGSAGTFYSHCLIHHEKNIGFIVFANSGHAGKACQELRNAVRKMLEQGNKQVPYRPDK